MSKSRVLSLLLLLPFLSYGQDFESRAHQYLTDLASEAQFTGNVLVALKGKIILQKSYGWANQATKTPNTLHTRFRIASVSKQFASTLIMQLEEKGKLKLSDPICKYLPDYPKGDSITIRQLLSHTSGIPEMTRLPGFVKNNIAAGNLYQKIDFFKNAPLQAAPGTKFSYANSNYLVLSAIAEKVSGLNYTQLLQQEILDKIPMRNSGINKTNGEIPGIAHGYAQLRKGKWQPAQPRVQNLAYGAGGMYSTVGDLYLWDRALYGDQILTERSKKQMHTPVKSNYGYGWIIRKVLGRTEYSHNGKTNGFLSLIARFPEEDACIIILSNSTSTRPGEIKAALAKMLFERQT